MARRRLNWALQATVYKDFEFLIGLGIHVGIHGPCCWQAVALKSRLMYRLSTGNDL